MNHRALFLIIVLVFAFTGAAPARAADAPAAGETAGAAAAGGGSAAPVDRMEIEKHVNCPCEDDCGKLLANCICGFSGSMRKELDAMIGAGMTKSEIFEALVKRYGVGVLASPGSSHWLDRVAWVGPFAALIIGALFLVRVVRRLVTRPAGEGASPLADPAGAEGAETPVRTGYEQKLEDELSRFES